MYRIDDVSGVAGPLPSSLQKGSLVPEHKLALLDELRRCGATLDGPRTAREFGRACPVLRGSQ